MLHCRDHSQALDEQNSTCGFGTTATQVGPAPLMVQPKAPAAFAAAFTALHGKGQVSATQLHRLMLPSAKRPPYQQEICANNSLAVIQTVSEK